MLLWARPLINPPAMDPEASTAILYQLLCQLLGSTPRLAVVLAMVLVLAESVWFNLLVSGINLTSQNSLLPTLLMVVALSAGCSTLTPMLLVTAALIGCMDQLLLRSTLLTIDGGKICGATALIGLATMFYEPAIAIMLSYFFVASNFRLYNWKDWVVMILGLLAPYTLLLAVLYMTDGLADWWVTTVDTMSKILISPLAEYSVITLIASSILCLIMLWSLTTTMGHLHERPVLWQRNATTLMLFTIGGIGMMLYTPLLPFRLHFFAIPFAFCATRTLLTAVSATSGMRKHKRTWIYDLVLILTIIAAIAC